MSITPVTIYINVNVIFVENNTKAEQRIYNIKHSFYGGDSVTSYDRYNSCIYLQHFHEKLYISTTFELNSVLYNPVLVYLHRGISVVLVIIYSI